MTLSLADVNPGSRCPHPPSVPQIRRPRDPVVRLDAAQQAVLAYDGPAALVVGAPGTGKTTLAVELVARHVRGGAAVASCLVLSPARAAAEQLRDRLVRRLGATTSEPLSRTPTGLAYAVLREVALRVGGPRPRLVSGAEQDAVLRDLLVGHRAGIGSRPVWPSGLRAAVGTDGFRAELRELLARAVEADLSPRDLRDLAVRTARPAWVAAAAVYQEYEDVMALSQPEAHEPADLARTAARLLRSDPELAARWGRRARVLVVDDAQELTPSAAALIEALTGPSTRLVLLGDPDATTQGFRGADPLLPGALIDAAAPDSRTFVLVRGWRQAGALRAVTGAIAGRIAAVGGGAQRRYREPTEVGPPPRADGTRSLSAPSAWRPTSRGAVEVRSFASTGSQADYLAASLRRDHLMDGVPWSQLAVITRTGAGAAQLRAALTARGVPVRVVAERPHLPSEPAIEPLLTVVDVATGVARGRVDRVPAALVEPLLRSSYGGLDAVAWRMLSRAARGTGGIGGAEGCAETKPDPPASADPPGILGRWLVDGLPPHIGRAFPGVRRVAAMIAAAAAAASWDAGADRWSARVTAAGVLWAAWSAAGLAPAWRDQARRRGPGAARADRDLDAVLAVFDAAERFDEQHLESGPDDFVRRLRALEFTAEPMPRRGRRDCVEVATVHAAVGRSWRRVAVAGVQDGVWPDLRPRGSLLGATELAEVMAGREYAGGPTREVLWSDETRLFHVAVSRAEEVLRVTAVDSPDEAPSSMFRAVAAVPGVDAGPAGDGRAADADDELVPMSLAGVVARLRRMVVDHPDVDTRQGAARRLAALAVENVPGADPSIWWGAATCTDGRPRRPAGTVVRVLPSGLEDLASCPLRWFVRACGARRPRVWGPARIGDVVHEVLATTSGHTTEELHARLDEVWPRLGMQPGWLERRARGDAEQMLTRAGRYLSASETAGRREVARELAVMTPVAGHLVTARLDRVEQAADGRLLVVDFKTGSTKPTAQQVRDSAQLGAYQLALSSRGPVGGAAFVQLGRAANRQLTVQEQAGLDDAPDPRWAHDLVRSSAEAMAADSFAARTGPWCRTCEAAPSCPIGSRR